MRSMMMPSSLSSLGTLPSSSQQQRGQARTTTIQLPPPHRLRSRRSPPSALPPDAALLSHLTDLAAHASVLAYERVVLPCQNMGCGDAVYRSTLDPVLRMETRAVALPQLLALAGTVTAYLTVRPGVAAGAIDFYILDRASRAMRRRVGPSDVEVGSKIAQGGFGSVYRATLLGEEEKEKKGSKKGGGSKASESSSPSSSSSTSSSSSRPVILKIATEFGPAEAWMNERLARAAPWAVANFITAFDETTEDGIDDFDLDGDDENGANGAKKRKQKRPRAKSAADGGPLWLLWEDEGPETATLSQLMNRRDWPYCAEPLLFGRELRLPKGSARRRGAVVKEIARQLLSALDALHAVGIVHRDVKPQNVIVSQQARRVKLIDLGAAADLRVGVNYSPNLSLMDPRFAPPEKYVMSRLTPEAPPPFLAAILSPVLWRLERPDRFDSYAVGVSLLQLCFPGLRSDDAVVAFQQKLASCGGDLEKWAEEVGARNSREYAEGFEFLDADNGAGWELLCGLTARAQRSRPAAAEALRHRWFKRRGGELPSASTSAAEQSFANKNSTQSPPSPSPLAPFTDALARASASAAAALGESLDSAVLGERDDGGLTEAWLSDEFSEDSDGSFSSNGNGDDDSDLDGSDRSGDPAAGDGGEFSGGGGKTMAWWRGRQAALRPLPKKKTKGGSRSGGSGASGSSSKAKKRADAAAAASSSSPSPRSGAAAAAAASPLGNLRLPWAKKEGGGEK